MAKVWLVTGSSRGLGRAIAEAVAASGDRLVATARHPRTLDDLVATYGDAVRTAPLDVTDPVAAAAAVELATSAFGCLDVVVNNAGYANLASVEDITLEDFEAQVATNLFGVVTVTKAASPVMRAQGSGHIIQVSSVGGRMANPGMSAYQSAKWAVGGFSSVLAQEVAPLGIKVTVLEPGGMTTDWGGSSMSVAPITPPYEATVGQVRQMLRTMNPLSDPAKVAQVVLDVTALEDPPLRLLLGSEAYTFARLAGQQLAASDERWRDITVSTDRDDATDADRDPLGLL